MPATSVNFLRRRRQQVARFHKLDKRILQVSIAVAVVAVAVTGGLLAYTQVLNAQLQEATREQRAAQAIVNQQARNEADYLLYAARLSILKDILEGRGSQRRALDFLSQLASSELTFDRIGFDDAKQSLVFRVQAQNVLAVERFIIRLREPEIRSQFGDLKLSEVKRDEERVYTLEIEAQLALSEGEDG